MMAALPTDHYTDCLQTSLMIHTGQMLPPRTASLIAYPFSNTPHDTIAINRLAYTSFLIDCNTFKLITFYFDLLLLISTLVTNINIYDLILKAMLGVTGDTKDYVRTCLECIKHDRIQHQP